MDDSSQNLSSVEIKTVIDALPKPAQTLDVRVSSLEKDIAALRSDVADAQALVKKVVADVGAALADVQSDIAAAKAVAPASLIEKFKAIESKVVGMAGALEQHFGVKL